MSIPTSKLQTVAMVKLVFILSQASSVTALARSLKMQQTTLLCLASGSSRPTAKTMATLTALGIQPSDWFTTAEGDVDLSGVTAITTMTSAASRTVELPFVHSNPSAPTRA
jgi:hypothetical protein